MRVVETVIAVAPPGQSIDAEAVEVNWYNGHDPAHVLASVAQIVAQAGDPDRSWVRTLSLRVEF